MRDYSYKSFECIQVIVVCNTFVSPSGYVLRAVTLHFFRVVKLNLFVGCPKKKIPMRVAVTYEMAIFFSVLEELRHSSCTTLMGQGCDNSDS